MLIYLHMRNFALIDEMSLTFYPGFNVLTGETGAGKSILIGAISLILGERASAEQIRSGSEQSLIEAAFSVSPEYRELGEIMETYGLSSEEEIIISREISRSGRNICRVNGRMVPLAALKEIGSVLVDLHGQHSHQSLLKPEQHLLLLDEFGDRELLAEKDKLQKLYNRLQNVKQKLSSRGETPEERNRLLELLVFQRDEILNARLSAEEEESLKQRLLLLDNMEKIIGAISRGYQEIYGGEAFSLSLIDRLGSVREELSSLVHIDPKLSSFLSVMEEAEIILSDLGRDLFAYLDELNFSPEEREEIESRLEVYRKLKRKYGQTVEDILLFAEKCQAEITSLEKGEEEALLLEKEAEELKRELEVTAGSLSLKRKETAQKLQRQVEEVLKELGMENAQFSVNFMEKDRVDSRGKEEVEFLFSANPGEPPKPLARIISAGEMARVMLAIKSILAEQDRIPTLIFDEIDSGIGGKTVQKVSEKMSRLGVKHQVICVTHSPHLASAADHQYYLYKEIKEGRAITRAEYLQGEKRVLEIARMLNGGSSSPITIQHAKELLKKSKK